MLIFSVPGRPKALFRSLQHEWMPFHDDAVERCLFGGVRIGNALRHFYRDLVAIASPEALLCAYAPYDYRSTALGRQTGFALV
jgi:hypothetical protein